MVVGKKRGLFARSTLLLAALALFSMSMLLHEGGAEAVTITVNSTLDTDDPSPDGVCDSDPGAAVVCTLREAIREANFLVGFDTINFNISPSGIQTMTPSTALPQITTPMTIDGTTQPGFTGKPLIQVNGTSAGASANGLTILGGGSTVRGLVINRFGANGISILTNGANSIEGNFIGTDVTGETDQGNGQNGIAISGAPNNMVGRFTPIAPNVISGNGLNGVLIQGPGATGNRVTSLNKIGTDVDGMVDVGNSGRGVSIDGAPNNRVEQSNVISGNDQEGVLITGSGATGNQIVGGNGIGVNSDTAVDLGNTLDGVSISSGGNTVQGNIISGNNGNGVEVTGNGNFITDNLIGTDGAGKVDVGNTLAGVSVSGQNNTVGGAAAPISIPDNVISGNNTYGVVLNGSGHMLQGNFVGTDRSGTMPLGNNLDGILLGQGPNTIGGTSPGARNIVSGNGQNGVNLVGCCPSGILVQGNLIGTQIDGVSPLGNVSHGILVGNIFNSTIGGTAPGAANTIAFNGGDGIFMTTNFDGVRFSGNSIHNNGLPSDTSHLGIDLSPDGVTVNDFGDSDEGPNRLQNFPELISVATLTDGRTGLEATLNSTPNTRFTIEFFSNSACDASNNGEGERFLGSQTVDTDPSGNVFFLAAVAGPAFAGESVTATAIDPNGNTSEFSSCIPCPAGQCAPKVTVRAGDGSAPGGGTTSVGIEVLGLQSPGLGAVTIDLPHEAVFWDATACSPDPNSVFDSEQCNAQFENDGLDFDSARCTANDTAGQTGNARICNVSFRNSDCTPETVVVLKPGVVTLANPQGNPIPFVTTPGRLTCGPLTGGDRGDVDCDGFPPDAVDALFVQQFVVNLRQGSDQCPPPTGSLFLGNADVNQDSRVDAVDALFIQQCVVGLRDCTTFQLTAAQSSNQELELPTSARRQEYPADRPIAWAFAMSTALGWE